MIPRSLVLPPDNPLDNSIKASAIVVLVESTVVVVPLTSKFPLTVKSANVTLELVATA